MELGKLVGYNELTMRMGDNSLMLDTPFKTFNSSVDDVNYATFSSIGNWDNFGVNLISCNVIIDVFTTIYNGLTFSNLTNTEQEILSKWFIATKAERDTVKTEDEQLDDANDLSILLDAFKSNNTSERLLNSDGIEMDNSLLNPSSVLIGGSLELDSILSTTITSDVDDWSPTGIGTASIIRLDSSTNNTEVSGITTGTPGRVLIIMNVGTKSIKFLENSGLSDSINRLRSNGATILNKSATLILIHDGTKWQIMSGM